MEKETLVFLNLRICELNRTFLLFLFQAFKSICDLLIIFSEVLGSINPIYKKLHYVSTAEQQAVLNGFVQHYVFATQEEGL